MSSFGHGGVLLTLSDSFSDSISDGSKYLRRWARRGEDASELRPRAIVRNDPKFREDKELIGFPNFVSRR
ncbi:hypothetical protein TIFTF001_036288 [Ficus carica]|uniref:Uncharacterized protein n=1 Tax=Ficus carica TaxID=3494 RepID=A0AA88J7H8_FICCA|nr:hypothetical protein TIFTF001_036288 [Ficus carica]